MPRGSKRGGGGGGGGRGGYVSSPGRLSFNQSNMSYSDFHQINSSDENLVYCSYCESERPMNKKSLSVATFCVSCKSAYHSTCIKNCQINMDGSVVECCGKPSRTSSNCQERYSAQKDLSNNQLKDILLDKINSLSLQLSDYNDRMNKAESDIDQLKKSMNALSGKFVSVPNPSSSLASVQVALSEIDERKRRMYNVLIYNVPEQVEKIDEKNDEKNDVALVNDILKDIELDTTISSSNLKRIGKLNPNLGSIRPLLLTLNTRPEVLNILRNWKKIPKDYKVSSDLTKSQRVLYNDLKLKAKNWNVSHPEQRKIVIFSKGNPVLVTAKHSDTSVSNNITSISKSSPSVNLSSKN